eukprot:Lithocolla_globosa_v1_NODE_1835_length_2308_cov_7.399024.p3 type:complete len:117 gc:universal NODE_1835_length_2308_cov_7.399024:2307-1957(-)
MFKGFQDFNRIQLRTLLAFAPPRPVWAFLGRPWSFSRLPWPSLAAALRPPRCWAACFSGTRRVRSCTSFSALHRSWSKPLSPQQGGLATSRPVLWSQPSHHHSWFWRLLTAFPWRR